MLATACVLMTLASFGHLSLAQTAPVPFYSADCDRYRLLDVDGDTAYLACALVGEDKEFLRSVDLTTGKVTSQIPISDRIVTSVSAGPSLVGSAVLERLEPKSVRVAPKRAIVQVSPFNYLEIDLLTGKAKRSLDLELDSSGAFISPVNPLNTLWMNAEGVTLQYRSGTAYMMLSARFDDFSVKEVPLDHEYRYLSVSPSGQITRRILARRTPDPELEFKVGEHWQYVESLPEGNFLFLNNPASNSAPLWIYSYTRDGRQSLYKLEGKTLGCEFGPVRGEFQVALDQSGSRPLWIFQVDTRHLEISDKALSEALGLAGLDKPESIALKAWGRHAAEAIIELTVAGSRRLMVVNWKTGSLVEIEGVSPDGS